MSRSRTTVAASAVALGVSAVVGAIVFTTTRNAPGAAGPRLADDRALANELSSLRREVEGLKGTQRLLLAQGAARQGTSMARGSGSTAQPESAPPGSPEGPEPHESAVEQNKHIAENLGAAFAAEPLDGEWSVKKQREIRDAFAGLPAGNELQKAQCASSLCEVVVHHSAPDLQRGFAQHIVDLDAFKAGLFFDYEQDPPRTTVYVVREGHTFAEFQH